MRGTDCSEGRIFMGVNGGSCKQTELWVRLREDKLFGLCWKL